MSNGGFTDYQVEKWLSQLTHSWVSLHYTHPVIDGAYASEVFGGSYVRQRVDMSSPGSRAIYVEQDARFQGLPHVRITHIAGWTTQYNGDMQWWAEIPEPSVVLEGKSFIVPSSLIALSLS